MHQTRALPGAQIITSKKRGSIRRWSLMKRTEVQIESGGKWTREEDTPFAVGPKSREEDTT